MKTLVAAVILALFAQPHAQRSVDFRKGDAARGRAAFVGLRCNACHRVAEDPSLAQIPDAWEGPLLHDLGKEPPEAVAWKIVTRSDLDPEAIYDTPMAEVASSITDQQLADLVAYLRNPRSAHRAK